MNLSGQALIGIWISYTVDSCSIDIPEEECRLIKDLIDGRQNLSKPKDRGFLFDIVASVLKDMLWAERVADRVQP